MNSTEKFILPLGSQVSPYALFRFMTELFEYEEGVVKTIALMLKHTLTDVIHCPVCLKYLDLQMFNPRLMGDVNNQFPVFFYIPSDLEPAVVCCIKEETCKRCVRLLRIMRRSEKKKQSQKNRN